MPGPPLTASNVDQKGAWEKCPKSFEMKADTFVKIQTTTRSLPLTFIPSLPLLSPVSLQVLVLLLSGNSRFILDYKIMHIKLKLMWRECHTDSQAYDYNLLIGQLTTENNSINLNDSQGDI